MQTRTSRSSVPWQYSEHRSTSPWMSWPSNCSSLPILLRRRSSAHVSRDWRNLVEKSVDCAQPVILDDRYVEADYDRLIRTSRTEMPGEPCLVVVSIHCP